MAGAGFEPARTGVACRTPGSSPSEAYPALEDAAGVEPAVPGVITPRCRPHGSASLIQPSTSRRIRSTRWFIGAPKSRGPKRATSSATRFESGAVRAFASTWPYLRPLMKPYASMAARCSRRTSQMRCRYRLSRSPPCVRRSSRLMILASAASDLIFTLRWTRRSMGGHGGNGRTRRRLGQPARRRAPNFQPWPPGPLPTSESPGFAGTSSWPPLRLAPCGSHPSWGSQPGEGSGTSWPLLLLLGHGPGLRPAPTPRRPRNA